jgi:hypothetical protein
MDGHLSEDLVDQDVSIFLHNLTPGDREDINFELVIDFFIQGSNLVILPLSKVPIVPASQV